MKNVTDRDLYSVCLNSSQVTKLFCDAICTGQITYREWYDLMTAPFSDNPSVDDEDLITRIIYAVRQGRIKIID